MADCSQCGGRLALWIVLAICGAAPLAAQQTPELRTGDDAAEQPAASVNVWTLEQLQQVAINHNPTLLQSAAAVDMARGLYTQAGIYPNPQLGYLRSDSDKSGATRTSGVFYGQEIVTRHKLQKAQSAETWDIEQMNWNYTAQLQRVRNDVHLRYLDLLTAQRSLKVTRQLVELSRKGLRAAEQAFEAKQVTKADILQARIQWRTAQVSQREAEARADAAWRQLAAVTGCNLVQAPVSGELPDQLPELDFEASYQRLLSDSPLVGAAKARAQHAQGTYQLERANAMPNMNVQVVAERDHVNQFSTVSTLLSMPVPVFNRNQGNIYHAAAETREAAAEISRTELALRDQLADTFQRYETARATVEQLRDDVLPDAEESLQISIQAYQAAEVSFLSVLTAQKTLSEVRLNYTEALGEAWRTHTEINGLLLTGALNPAELGTALQATPGSSVRRSILKQLEGNTNRSLLPGVIQGAQ